MHPAGRTSPLLVAVLAASLQAQDLPTPERITVDLGPVLRYGSTVRVSGGVLHRLGGVVVDVRGDTILLGASRASDATAAQIVPLAGVDTLWTRSSRFVPGLALGISTGATLGALSCVFAIKERCNILPVAAAAGGLVGGVIGKMTPNWRRRYVRRDGGPVPVIGSWLRQP
jgi:hypothetical protein